MLDFKGKDFLTQKEVADILRVSVGTVISRREKGLLPYLRFPGTKRVVYPVEGVSEALRQSTTQSKEVQNQNTRRTVRKKEQPVISTTENNDWRI